MADYIFNVARLLAQTSGSRRTVDVSARPDVLDVPEVIGTVRGVAQLTRLSDAILVTGRMRTVVRVPCARCMDDLDLQLAFDLDDQFVPCIDPVRGGPVDPDDRWLLDRGHNLDLSPVLAEAAISELPPRVVCPGQCRSPLLDQPVTARALDPRLAPLERLRRQMLHQDGDSHG